MLMAVIGAITGEEVEGLRRWEVSCSLMLPLQGVGVGERGSGTGREGGREIKA